MATSDQDRDQGAARRQGAIQQARRWWRESGRVGRKGLYAGLAWEELPPEVQSQIVDYFMTGHRNPESPAAAIDGTDPLTAAEHAWLRDCARFLGVTTPNVALDGRSTPDIAYTGTGRGYAGGEGTIMLGKKFLAHPPDSFLRRQKLLHETIHHAGVQHDDRARAAGYHSNPERDRFTREATRALEARLARVQAPKRGHGSLGARNPPGARGAIRAYRVVAWRQREPGRILTELGTSENRVMAALKRRLGPEYSFAVTGSHAANPDRYYCALCGRDHGAGSVIGVAHNPSLIQRWVQERWR